MNLSDYLRAQRGSGSKLKKFYGDYAYLNNVKIPSPIKIWSHQKRIFKQMYGINDTNTSSWIMEELQKDLAGTSNLLDFSNMLDQNIRNIEQHVQALNRNSIDSVMDEADKLFNIKTIDDFITDYKNFINSLKNMKSIKEIEFAIKPLETRLEQLQNIATSLSNGEVPPKGSLKNRISWVEYILKGQYLEEKGTEFFQSKLPNNIVLNTGSLKGYYDIMGNFKNSGSMKEDIMIFDNPNFTISFTIGKNDERKTMTLKEFINFLENSSEKQTIRLTQEGYDALMNNAISSIQAKATRTSHIKFGNINIRTADREIQGEALLSLKNLYQEQMKVSTYNTAKGNTVKRRTSIIVASHKDYDALFNYNLARNITHVIGKNNLLLTRHGVTDMYSYIMNQFEAGRYFYGIDINLASNGGNKIAIGNR